MAEAAATTATTARKTRKTTARKTARKATARKPAARKATRTPALTLERVQDTVKEVAYVQLGIAGRVYDEFNARAAKARKDAPKQWDALVKRGEKVQRDLEKAGKELRTDLQSRVDTDEVKARVEQRISQVRKAVSKLSQRVRKAA
jgi:hypothetical protein